MRALTTIRCIGKNRNEREKMGSRTNGQMATEDLWVLASNLETLAYRLPLADQPIVLRYSVDLAQKAFEIERRDAEEGK
jgi:hypothetical protein